jgi:hypothetical protein
MYTDRSLYNCLMKINRTMVVYLNLIIVYVQHDAFIKRSNEKGKIQYDWIAV